MFGFDSLLRGRQHIGHPFTVKVPFPELAQKFDGSRVARFWITPGGSGSNGLSVDLGIDSPMDQVEIALRQRDVRFPDGSHQQLRLGWLTKVAGEQQSHWHYATVHRR